MGSERHEQSSAGRKQAPDFPTDMTSKCKLSAFRRGSLERSVNLRGKVLEIRRQRLGIHAPTPRCV